MKDGLKDGIGALRTIKNDEDLAALKTEINEKLGALTTEKANDIGALRAEINEKLAALKIE